MKRIQSCYLVIKHKRKDFFLLFDLNYEISAKNPIVKL